MSLATKWQITFRSRSRTYTVNILVDGYSGAVIPLRGAENPFVTNEDNSEDYFTPIRKQTGYLRIIDDGKDLNGDPFNWTDLIPANNTAHQVRLVYGGDVLWIGYMKADMFTTQAFEYGTEYEFPLVCPLGLLDIMPFTFTSDGSTIKTFAQVLHMALSATGVNWVYVDVSANVQGWADLNARVNLINYTSVDPSVNTVTDVGTWTDPSAWSSVIESICQFWGWTIYTRGLNIYIVANGYANRFRRFAFLQFASNIAAEINTYTGESKGIGALSYMSTDHYEDYIPGRRNIKLSSASGEWGNVIAPALKELQYDWYGGSGHVLQYGDYSSIQFFLHNTGANIQYLHEYKLIFSPAYIGGRANILLSEDDSWLTDSDKDSFSLRNNIQVLTGGTQPSSVLDQREFSITSLYSVCAPNGSMISISASARASLNPNESTEFNPETDYVRMFLRIGDKYWNGSNGWTTSPTAFNVYMSANGRIKTTKSLFNAHYGATGYCIPMTQSLYGQMEVAILMSPSRDILLDAFTVKIVPTDDMVFPTAKSEHELSGFANSTFADDFSVNLDLASGNNNKYGKGQVYNNDGSYLNTVTFVSASGSSSWTSKPESQLLARMQTAYSKIRHRLQIDVAEDVDAALPTTDFTHWDDNSKVYHLQSVSHQWADDKMKITIIEQ